MIDHISALDMGDDGFVIFGIGTKSIGLPGDSRLRHPFIAHQETILACIIFPIFEPVVKRGRAFVLLCFDRVQFTRLFFLAKCKPITFYPVIGTETFYGELFIVDQRSWFGDGMDMKGVTELRIRYPELYLYDLL